MVATISLDPLSTIDGHHRWKTGQELIDFLDSDPNVFRGEFSGNQWQGLGGPWLECPPEDADCPYRLEEGRPRHAARVLPVPARDVSGGCPPPHCRGRWSGDAVQGMLV